MLFRRKKRIIKQLENNFGQVKTEGFNFDLIKRNFNHKTSFKEQFYLNEQTCNDLDFDLFFCYIDRTNSKIGQQYLYSKLRNIEFSEGNFQQQENIISQLIDKPNDRIQIQYLLNKLNTSQSYYLDDLIHNSNDQKPKWYFLLPILSFGSAILIFLSFFYSSAFFAFFCLLPVNILVHYGLKRQTTIFINSIPSLLTFGEVARRLSKFNILKPIAKYQSESIRFITSIKRKMSFFKLEQKLDSDLEAAYWFLLEFIKIIFLLEPLLLFSSINQLRNKSKDIESVFNFIGQIDTYISILSLRSGIEYCKPNFTQNKESLEFEDLRHPLIPNCVPNSLKLDSSIVLTGSNMSGKTTFMRSIGLNYISGIVLNTCFSTYAKLPLTKLFSVIRIEDDILSSSSYFYKEINEIKSILSIVNNNESAIILLDELFKGTNTLERISCAKAVLSYLEHKNCHVIVSTHDLELTQLLNESHQLFHFSESIIDSQIHFDYKLKKGTPKSGNAIKILNLNKFPNEIIQDATETLHKVPNIAFNNC